MFPVRDAFFFLVPSFSPPLRFVRAPCSSAHLARLLSPFVLFASYTSITYIQPPPSSVWSLPSSVPHRPSVGELSTLRLRPTNILFYFPDPESHMQACTPPDLCGWWYLAWVWVCVEGQKKTPPRWSGVRRLVGRHHRTDGQVHAYARRSTSLCLSL